MQSMNMCFFRMPNLLTLQRPKLPTTTTSSLEAAVSNTTPRGSISTPWDQRYHVLCGCTTQYRSFIPLCVYKDNETTSTLLFGVRRLPRFVCSMLRIIGMSLFKKSASFKTCLSPIWNLSSLKSELGPHSWMDLWKVKRHHQRDRDQKMN